MIVYNVTVHVQEQVENAWLDYMLGEHLADVLATGCFLDARLSKLLLNEPQGGITYSVQYTAHDQESLERYQSEFAQKLQADHVARFGEQCLAFRTSMQVIAHIPASNP